MTFIVNWRFSQLFYSVICGALASTPFAWCFIFKVSFVFTHFPQWPNAIYNWSLFAVQLMIMIFTVVTMRKPFSNMMLSIVCAASIMGCSAPFICAHVNFYPWVTVPTLFVIECVLLCVWVPVVWPAVLFCDAHVQAVMQVGFFGLLEIYYVMLQFNLLWTPAFLLPLVTALTLGVCLRNKMITHPYSVSSRERCLAVFTVSNTKFVSYSLKYVTDQIALPCLRALTYAVIYTVTILIVSQNHVALTYMHLHVFFFGCAALCCGWITSTKLIVPIIEMVFSVASVISLEYISFTGTSKYIFLSISFFSYVAAVACELKVIQAKLDKCIFMPHISLIINLACHSIVCFAVTAIIN